MPSSHKWMFKCRDFLFISCQHFSYFDPEKFKGADASSMHMKKYIQDCACSAGFFLVYTGTKNQSRGQQLSRIDYKCEYNWSADDPPPDFGVGKMQKHVFRE